MTRTNTYLDKKSEELEKLENFYNFLPRGQEAGNLNHSLNRHCLGKTTKISRLRAKKMSTRQLEKILTQYRHFAVNCFKRNSPQ